MTKVTVDLPQSVKRYVADAADRQGFASDAEFVLALILRERDRDALRKELEAGLAREPIAYDQDYVRSLMIRAGRGD